jgi:hypothetical protein
MYNVIVILRLIVSNKLTEARNRVRGTADRITAKTENSLRQFRD